MSKHQVKESDENFPSSKSRKFWGKAEVVKINKKELQVPDMSKHTRIIQKGPYFICTSCPHEHTIPLDPNKYTVKDGKIVPLDKPIKK